MKVTAKKTFAAAEAPGGVARHGVELDVDEGRAKELRRMGLVYGEKEKHQRRGRPARERTVAEGGRRTEDAPARRTAEPAPRRTQQQPEPAKRTGVVVDDRRDVPGRPLDGGGMVSPNAAGLTDLDPGGAGDVRQRIEDGAGPGDGTSGSGQADGEGGGEGAAGEAATSATTAAASAASAASSANTPTVPPARTRAIAAPGGKASAPARKRRGNRSEG